MKLNFSAFVQFQAKRTASDRQIDDGKMEKSEMEIGNLTKIKKQKAKQKAKRIFPSIGRKKHG